MTHCITGNHECSLTLDLVFGLNRKIKKLDRSDCFTSSSEDAVLGSRTRTLLQFAEVSVVSNTVSSRTSNVVVVDVVTCSSSCARCSNTIVVVSTALAAG